MGMKFELLSNNQEWLPTIANWYVSEWGNLKEIKTEEEEIEKLKVYLNESKIPLIILALEKCELLGVAQLKTYEMSIYPDFKYWLGGVYVNQQYRKKGIAKSIVKRAINKAIELNVETLYLQTENLKGGLYKELGWTKVEEVNYNGIETLVMKKIIT